VKCQGKGVVLKDLVPKSASMDLDKRVPCSMCEGTGKGVLKEIIETDSDEQLFDIDEDFNLF